MKRCPQCGRDYNDPTLSFCLDDGTALLDGPATSEGPLTAILPDPGSTSESPTRTLDAAETGATRLYEKQTGDASHKAPSRRSLVIFGIAGVLVVTALAIGGYYFWREDPSKQIESIAVLPFENRSGNADTDYLSDGLADSLISHLSRLPNLKVSPTSSVIRYKGKDTDVVQIAKELEVDAVMSGRLVQRGDDLSISVQLIDSRSAKVIWAEQYDRRMADLLATEREIARTITQKLQLKLSGDERDLTRKYTDSNEAYQLYLKGRYHFARRTKDDFLKAIDHYQQAVRLDPKFAIGYVGLADAYNLAPANQRLSGRESLPQAKAAAERALAIDPSLAEAHSALAVNLVFYGWNWTESEREFKKAIELNPNVADIHYYYGLWILNPTGRFEEAIREIKLALELEPLSIPFAANLVSVYIAAGQKRLALEQAQQAYNLDPNHPHTPTFLGFAYIENEMYAEAIVLAEKRLREAPDSLGSLTVAGIAYARKGERQKAEEVIARYQEIAKSSYVSNARIAQIYAALGDRDKAFAELEEAFRQQDAQLAGLKFSRVFAPMRDDPRFKDLLKRMNLAE